MPWHDPARLDESAEDRVLRGEMRQLLGLPGDGPLFEAEPTPEMIQLAERLRAEANRRRRTSRQRPAWMLLAAGLPFVVALGALGHWGLQHKRRADQLAARQASPGKPDSTTRQPDPSGTTPTSVRAEEPATPADRGSQGRETREESTGMPPAAERLQAMAASPRERDRTGKRIPPKRPRKPGELVIPAEPADPRIIQPTYQVKQPPR